MTVEDRAQEVGEILKTAILELSEMIEEMDVDEPLDSASIVIEAHKTALDAYYEVIRSLNAYAEYSK